MNDYSFTPINTRSELNVVVMQLRLKQLPMTLDVLKKIREVIEKPQIDEELRKVVEREFSTQWKEIKKKHHINAWTDRNWGDKPKVSSNLMLFQGNKNTKQKSQTTQQKEKQESTSSTLSKYTKKTVSRPVPKKTKWGKNNKQVSDTITVFNISVPRHIESRDQLHEVFLNVKKLNARGYTLSAYAINKILSCIQRADLRLCFIDNMRALSTPPSPKIENAEPAKKPKVIKLGSMSVKTSKPKVKRNSKPILPKKIISPANVAYVSNKDKEDDKLYETFEYGLSDWDA